MQRLLPLLRVLCVMGILPMMLAACDAVDDGMQPATVVDLPQAPVEASPQLQDPEHEIWIPGYWQPSGSSFTWISGKVIARPSPTAVWASARWVQHSYGWSFMRGHWE